MPENALLMILVGAALSVSLFIYALYTLLRASKYETDRRLGGIKHMSDETILTGPEEADEKLPLGQRIVRASGNLSQAMHLGQSARAKQKSKLQRAGILLKPEELNGITILTALLFALLFMLFTQNLWLGLLGLLIGGLIPGLVVEMKLGRRSKKLNDQLPEALGVIANGIRAGFSFPQAVAMVVREMEEPIADEFGKLLRENSLGKPMDEALANLSARTEDEDLDIVITALLIQRQVGGSLADVLDTISDTIRERVKLKGDIRTLTAQGKLSAVIVSVMPFAMALMLNLVNPGYMSIMFTNPIGIIALIFAGVSMLLGMFVLSKIIKIKV